MKHFLFLCFVLTALMLSNATYAQKKQKPFEGTITYDVNYTGENASVSPVMVAMMPTTYIYKAKGNKVYCEFIMMGGAAATSTIIYDGDAKKMYTIMKMMDTAIAVVFTYEESQKYSDSIYKNDPKSSFKKLNDTKIIAGYTCKNGLYTHPKMDSLHSMITDTVWYNEELYSPAMKLLPSAETNQMAPGLVAETVTYMQIPSLKKQISLKLTQRLKKVKKEKIPDSIFEIPKGVKIMTMKEVKEMNKKDSKKDEDKK